MDIDYSLIAAGISQGFCEQLLESLLLAFGGQGSGAAEQFFHQGRLQNLRVACIIKHAVQIGVPVVEGGEQESRVGSLYDPVADPVFDTVLFRVVAKSCFGQLDRADTAEQIFIGVVGSVEHLHAVRRLFRDIICRVDQYDIVVFPIGIVFYDFFVEFFQQNVVLQTAVTKF